MDDDDDNWDAFVPGNYTADRDRREDIRLFSEVKTFLTGLLRSDGISGNYLIHHDRIRAQDLLNRLKDK